MYKFFLSIILFVSFNISFGQVILNDNGHTETQSIAQTDDGGFIIAGYTNLYGSGQEDVFVTKFDNQKNIEWSNTYGTSNIEKGYPIFIAKTNTGYVVSSNSTAYAPSLGGLVVLSLDFNGNILWQRKIDNSNNYTLSRFIGTDNDGNILVSGSNAINSAGTDDAYLLKLDLTNGSLLWSITYGTGLNDHSFNAIETDDGGYIFGGISVGAGTGYSAKILIKVNALGQYQWTKTYDNSYNEIFYDYQISPDGNILAVGIEGNFNAYDINITKLSQSGNVIWSKNYGGPNNDKGGGIEILSTGEFYISGYSNSFGNGNYDIFLSKFDINGTELWTKFYGGNLDEDTYISADPISINETDGKIYLFSNSKSYGGSDLDPFLLTTDLEGNSSCEAINTNWIFSDENPIVTNVTSTLNDLGTMSNSFFQLSTFNPNQDTICFIEDVQETDTSNTDETDSIISLFQDCLATPNAFSPNGDNINDNFYPIIRNDSTQINTFRVYNRWGEQIHNGNYPWNGKYQNEDQGIGIYIYYIIYTCNNEEKRLIGNVTLIR